MNEYEGDYFGDPPVIHPLVDKAVSALGLLTAIGAPIYLGWHFWQSLTR